MKRSNAIIYRKKLPTFIGNLELMVDEGLISEDTGGYVKALWKLRNGLIHEVFELGPYLKEIGSHIKGSVFEDEIRKVLPLLTIPNPGTLQEIECIQSINTILSKTSPTQSPTQPTCKSKRLTPMEFERLIETEGCYIEEDIVYNATNLPIGNVIGGYIHLD